MEATKKTIGAVIFLFVLANSGYSQDTKTPKLLIDDFEDGNKINLLGGSWFKFDDDVKGGESKVVIKMGSPGALKSEYCIRMEGKLSDAYEYSFLGIGTFVSGDRETPKSFLDYKKIVFWAKGDGKRYKINLYSPEVKDFSFHEYYFKTTKEWQKIEIPLEKFIQPEWAAKRISVKKALKKVLKIQWQTDSDIHTGKVDLWIDNIYFE